MCVWKSQSTNTHTLKLDLKMPLPFIKCTQRQYYFPATKRKFFQPLGTESLPLPPTFHLSPITRPSPGDRPHLGSPSPMPGEEPAQRAAINPLLMGQTSAVHFLQVFVVQAPEPRLRLLSATNCTYT